MQTRSFCYVDDEVRGIAALFDSDVVEPVNIGNPDEYTILELADVMREVTGSTSDIEFAPLPVGDPTRRRPDITRARALLGWEPASRTPRRTGAHARLVHGGARPWPRGETRSASELRRLTVVVPVYNERNTLVEIVRRMRAVELPDDVQREIIIVDDGSDDGTRDVLKQLGDNTVRIVLHDRNRGKGAAVRTGIEHAKGDYVLVQDADLEYDPEDWPKLIRPVLSGKARVVYGSRFTGERRNMLFLHWVGNRFLSLVTNVLYNTTLSDMETCYKLVDRALLDGIELRANGFDIEPELTAKLLKRKVRIYEVPISYTGREYSEGKKITWRDGVGALWTLLKYRFRD